LNTLSRAVVFGTIGGYAIGWRTRMAKKKHPKMTAEDRARYDETQRMVRERIAYHEAKALEQAQKQASQQS
jgi:lipopolysaccharide biosynthesis protein